MQKPKPIRDYCRRHGITLGDFAVRINRSVHSVKKWEGNRGRRVPTDAIPSIERATAGELTFQVLRPDLYPANDDQKGPE